MYKQNARTTHFPEPLWSVKTFFVTCLNLLNVNKMFGPFGKLFMNVRVKFASNFVLILLR